jgi:D-arabinose 5-phosphate isomerase GutQ
MTSRDAQIHTFGQLAQLFGGDWLGKVTARRIAETDAPYIVLSDGGRSEEIVPIVRAVGKTNVMIVQIMREGTSFANDIRTYVSLPGVTIKPALNRTLAEYQAEMCDLASAFFAE